MVENKLGHTFAAMNETTAVTHLDPPQEEKKSLKDIFQQLEPLRERHDTHLISKPTHTHTHKTS